MNQTDCERAGLFRCPKNHFMERGFHFAPTNTGATKDKHGEEYIVEYEGSRYETHMHIKLGQFRMYFCLEKNRAIVGAIGDHLPIASYDP